MGRVAGLVFAKPPAAGQAKTRLAATIGFEPAAALARAFLRDTIDALAVHDWLHVVVSTPEPTVDHGVDVELWDQGTGELGERLERAFSRALREFDAAIALGSDSPGLPSGHLLAMRARLGEVAVLGPCDDGGFWGLGLHRFPAGMLLGVPWSASGTATATAERLVAHGFGVVEAPGWWDVDLEADLGRLRREVPRADAPATHAVLDDLGWT